MQDENALNCFHKFTKRRLNFSGEVFVCLIVHTAISWWSMPNDDQ